MCPPHACSAPAPQHHRRAADSSGGRPAGTSCKCACVRDGLALVRACQAHPPRASCSAAACASVRARALTAAAAPSSSAAAAISAAARPAPGPALRAAASAAGSHPRGRGRAYRPDCSASLGAPPLPAGASERPRGGCSSRPARRRAAAAAPEQARATRAGSASASSPLRLRKLVTRLSYARQGRVGPSGRAERVPYLIPARVSAARGAEPHGAADAQQGMHGPNAVA